MLMARWCLVRSLLHIPVVAKLRNQMHSSMPRYILAEDLLLTAGTVEEISLRHQRTCRCFVCILQRSLLFLVLSYSLFHLPFLFLFNWNDYYLNQVTLSNFQSVSFCFWN